MSMPTTLGGQLGSVPARRILSRDRDTYRGVADGAGKAVITMPVIPQSGQELLIERRGLRTLSAGTPVAVFYIDSEDLRNFLDGSEGPQMDVSDENHAVLITAGHQLVCVVTGLDANAEVYLSVQWRVEGS